ncbi:MAG: hypothetical protein HC906_09435 [Bacteroidales bacterium]|nr:hypothetical protein [Bacteroidales bacterium]
MIRNYVYLNAGLTIRLNGVDYYSKNGLMDLLTENIGSESLYTPIHLKNGDIEVALTHGNEYGETYFSL